MLTQVLGIVYRAISTFLIRRAGLHVQCAKVNGLEPYAYLRRVFTELPRAQSLGDVEALLPTRLTPADLTRAPLRGILLPACQ